MDSIASAIYKAVILLLIGHTQLALAVLWLCGVIDWPWVAVFGIMLIPAALFVVAALIAGIVAAVKKDKE